MAAKARVVKVSARLYGWRCSACGTESTSHGTEASAKGHLHDHVATKFHKRNLRKK